MSEVHNVRHRGYSVRVGKPIPEVSAIGMSLPSSIHGIPLSFGVGGLTERIIEKQAFIVDTMHRLSGELRQKLTDERSHSVQLAS